MGDTKIQWASKVWNPFGGCTKVSAGCANCYAGLLAEGNLRSFYPDGFWNGAYFFRHRMEQPLKWRKPAVIFVGSMGDIFHDNIPNSYIDEIFGVMKKAPQHTFMLLTKRPARMRQYLETRYEKGGLPNVWVGVSVENQATANARIDELMWISIRELAAKTFVSYEPAIGLVDFCAIEYVTRPEDMVPGLGYSVDSLASERGRGIDLVIMGGESGSNARPVHPGWARFVRNQCNNAGVPFFFKQWGEWSSYDNAILTMPHDDIIKSESIVIDHDGAVATDNCGVQLFRVGKEFAGHLLDGIEYHEWPL